MLINKRAVKSIALDLAEHRFGFKKFNRVSKTFFNRFENEVRNLLVKQVRELPSCGKTIK